MLGIIRAPIVSRLAKRRYAPPSPALHSPSLANALSCRLATARPDVNGQRRAPEPSLEPALSHAVRTSMALMVVRTVFARTIATISLRLDYLDGLKRLRMSALPPHLAIQEGASIRSRARPDAISCSPSRATHYMMCSIVSKAHERKDRPSHLCKLTHAEVSRRRLTGRCKVSDITPIQGLGVPLHAIAAGHEGLPTPRSASQDPVVMNALVRRFGNRPPW